MEVSIRGIQCPNLTQPFSDAARDFVVEFCFLRDVKLVNGQIDDDVFVAEVVVDERNLGRFILGKGLAWHDKQKSNDKNLARYEQQAREAKRGLWSDPDAVAPWDWQQ
jgi:endonuclease YncB( thermonuclease family)